MMIDEKYKLILKDLIVELDYTQTILDRMGKEDYGKGVKLILTQYSDLFKSNHERYGNLIYDHIYFKIGYVGKSTSMIRSAAKDTNDYNGNIHISLKMKSEEIKKLDSKEANKISDLISFYRYLFTTTNNYSIYKNTSDLIKFQSFIDDAKKDINYFIVDDESKAKKQEDDFLRIKAQEKDDDALIQQGITKKKDWEEYLQFIKDEKIYALYHFTSRKNIPSIRKQGGLYSWANFSLMGEEKASVGNENSKTTDAQKGFEDYVRLSFCPEHPMSFSAKKEGRLEDMIVLQIKPEILYHLGTWHSDMNAIDNGVTFSNKVEQLQSFDFRVFRKYYTNLNSDEKKSYQAEVLVRHKVPLEFITNLNQFLL